MNLLSTLRALIGLNLTLFRNSVFARRSRVGYKNAVSPRKASKPVIVVILIAFFLFQGFTMSHSVVDSARVRIYNDSFPDKKLIDRSLIKEFERRNGLEGNVENKGNDFFDLKYTNRRRSRYGFNDVKMDGLQAHYKQFGASGFYTIHDVEKYVKSDQASSFGSYVWVVLVFTFVCLLCNALSAHLLIIKQQSGKDDMLSYLPIKGSVVLLGSFCSRSAMRILAWLAVFPLMTVVIKTLGHSYLIAVPSALLFTLLYSAMISGVEIVIDTWLRYAAPKRLVNIAQKLFAVLGILGMYGVLAMFFSRTVDQWIHEKLAVVFGENNYLGWVFSQESSIILLNASLFIVAVIIGTVGCWLAGKILDGGITYSLNEQGERLSETDSREKSLWQFEKLALLRTPGIAIQIIIIPVVYIMFQVFVNPSIIEDVEFRTLCALGVGSGSYACILSISRIFSLEQKGLWIIQTLPCDISEYFNRRERLWRIIGAFVGGAIIVFGVFWRHAYSVEDLALAALSLIGLWMVGKVVNGIMMGNPESDTREEATKVYTPKMGKMYLAMFVAGTFTALVVAERLWGLCVVNFIFWLLGSAIWDRQRVCYRYMFDPTEKAPKEWSVSSGLWLVVAFFGFQTIGLVFFMALPSPEWTLLASFIFGGVLTLVVAMLMGRKMNEPLRAIAKGELAIFKVVTITVGLAVACLVIAKCWLWSLVVVGVTLPESTVDISYWPMVILIVFAAPLLEEPIFRGKIYRAMQTAWSVKKSMLISSLLFAVVHPGFSFLPVFCLGLACAWLYQKSGSLKYSILLHALYNFGAVCIL